MRKLSCVNSCRFRPTRKLLARPTSPVMRAEQADRPGHRRCGQARVEIVVGRSPGRAESSHVTCVSTVSCGSGDGQRLVVRRHQRRRRRPNAAPAAASSAPSVAAASAWAAAASRSARDRRPAAPTRATGTTQINASYDRTASSSPVPAHGFSSVPDCSGVVDALSICAFGGYIRHAWRTTSSRCCTEKRVFPPPADFAARAAGQVDGRVRGALRARRGRSRGLLGRGGAPPRLDRSRSPQILDESKAPFVRWFADGKLNLAANCLDRHLPTRGDKPALIWVGEPGDRRTLTYRELHAEVCRAANALTRARRQGRRSRRHLPADDPRAGDRDARLRAHRRHALGHLRRLLRRPPSAIASTTPAQAHHHRRRRLAARQGRAAQGQRRRARSSTAAAPSRRSWSSRAPKSRWRWSSSATCAGSRRSPTASAEHDAPSRSTPSIRCSSSTPRARPASRRASCTRPAATRVQAQYTTRLVFDLRDDDVYWCTADIGWVTGHSYVVYGPLVNGATVGDVRRRARLPGQGSLLGDHREGALHHLLHGADRDPRLHALGRRVAGASTICRRCACSASVGEPINPEAWMWYRRVIGGDRCPIVDTWWQTETGAIMISPLPGATPTKPGSCTRPLPGIVADVVDKRASRARPTTAATSCVRRPWPSMLRTIWGDPDRYVKTYFSEIFVDGSRSTSPATARAATRTATSGSWAASTTCSTSPATGSARWRSRARSSATRDVAEAAVVGRPDELKGQAVVAFVTLKAGRTPSDAVKQALREHVVARDRRAGAARGDPLHRGAAQDALGQDHAPPAQGDRRRRRRSRATSPRSRTWPSSTVSRRATKSNYTSSFVKRARSHRCRGRRRGRCAGGAPSARSCLPPPPRSAADAEPAAGRRSAHRPAAPNLRRRSPFFWRQTRSRAHRTAARVGRTNATRGTLAGAAHRLVAARRSRNSCKRPELLAQQHVDRAGAAVGGPRGAEGEHAVADAPARQPHLQSLLEHRDALLGAVAAAVDDEHAAPPVAARRVRNFSTSTRASSLVKPCRSRCACTA